VNEEKIAFLCRHIPGMRDLTGKKLKKAAYCFQKAVFPRGYVFLAQGTSAKKGIFIVTSGSVELYCRERAVTSACTGAPSPEVRRLGVLVRGSLFGSSVASGPEPFTAVVHNSPCEVFYVSGGRLNEVPFVIREGVRKLLAQTMLLRLQRCDPALDTPLTASFLCPAETPSNSRPGSGGRKPSKSSQRMLDDEMKMLRIPPPPPQNQQVFRRGMTTGVTAGLIGWDHSSGSWSLDKERCLAHSRRLPGSLLHRIKRSLSTGSSGTPMSKSSPDGFFSPVTPKPPRGMHTWSATPLHIGWCN